MSIPSTCLRERYLHSRDCSWLHETITPQLMRLPLRRHSQHQDFSKHTPTHPLYSSIPPLPNTIVRYDYLSHQLTFAIMAIYPGTEGEITLDVPRAGKPCKTWYKLVGDLNATLKSPIIALHGGPGSGHDYMIALTELYKKRGIPIVFYDQIGCGRSTHLPEKIGDEEFWTFELFIRELDNLIDHLCLRNTGFHLVGQSWGGMLAAAYAAKQPVGLKKIVLQATPGRTSTKNPRNP